MISVRTQKMHARGKTLFLFEFDLAVPQLLLDFFETSNQGQILAHLQSFPACSCPSGFLPDGSKHVTPTIRIGKTLFPTRTEKPLVGPLHPEKSWII
ncbi:hypothetical protein CBD41_08225 [bacterium TMED181]|nr:MAG: hypothetical protein CBD41_08225 [bacterium TMED181]